MSHYLKLVMDAVFGRRHFRNEVVWCYTGPGNVTRYFKRKHDILLWYTRSKQWTFNADDVRRPFVAKYTPARGVHGANLGVDTPEKRQRHDRGTIPTDWWADGFLSNVSAYRKELVGYPTQKPLKLLQRIITACSNPGDVVFDPFCGCATTLVAANDLGRAWAGIDISEKAAELVVARVKDRGGLFGHIVHRTDIPQRTDLGPLPAYNCAANRRFLYGEQSGNCAGCRTHFEARHLEVDHIIARSTGGTDHPGNLQLLCGHCNRVKGDRGMEYLRVKLQLST